MGCIMRRIRGVSGCTRVLRESPGRPIPQIKVSVRVRLRVSVRVSVSVSVRARGWCMLAFDFAFTSLLG